MDQKIILTQPGGPDRLQATASAPETPGAGQVRIRHEAIGVNFVDIYHRTGLYPLPGYPAILGVEGAGIVEATGDGVTRFKAGDRIAYAGAPVGAYTATRLLPAERLVRLPDGVPARLAAASMLKGLTAHMLLSRVHAVGPDTSVLVHAAAGGLGTMLVRWAKHLGATVIGTVSNEEKAAKATANGADHVIVGRDADFGAEAKAFTGGRGVDFAIDGIGGLTLEKTFDCVAPFGTVASVGQAAGPVPPIAIQALGRGSIALSRPSVMAYSADMDVYADAAADLMAFLQTGLHTDIGAEYALADAARAHEDLEAGRTTGSLILIP